MAEKNPAEYLGETYNFPKPEEKKEIPTSGKAFTFPGGPNIPEGYKFYTKEQQEQGLHLEEGYTRQVPTEWVQSTMRQLNKPNQAYFAQDPKRLAKYYNFIRTAPQDWQPPEWMDVARITQAYDFMRDYSGDDWSQWQPLEPDDPASIYLTAIPEPPRQLWMPNESSPRDDLIRSMSAPEPEEEELFVGQTQSEYDKLMKMLYPDDEQRELSPFMKEGAWESLEPWQRFALSFFSTQPMEDRPEWTRQTAAGIQGLQAAIGGKVAGGLLAGAVGAGIGAATGTTVAPAVGTVAGILAGAFVGYKAYQGAMTGEVTPWVNKLLEFLDIAATSTEKVVGLAVQAADGEEREILENLPAAWKAGELTYESMPAGTKALNWLSKTAKAINPDWSSGRLADVDAGEVWQLEQAIAEPVLIEGGLLAGSALDEVRARIIENPDDIDIIYADFIQRFGYGGTVGDFFLQSVLDPLNYASFGLDAIGEQVGKVTNKPGLAESFRVAKGNIAIDSLPPLIQEFTEASLRKIGDITNIQSLKEIHGSKGVLTALDTYKSFIRQGKVEGPLTEFDRWVGNLTETGAYAELQPQVEQQKGVKGWFKYMTQLDRPSQAILHTDLMMTTTNAILDVKRGDPGAQVKLLQQLGAQDVTAVGKAAASMIKSPAASTVAASIDAFNKTGVPLELYTNYQATETIRAKLHDWSTRLGLNDTELANIIETNPEKAINLLRNNGIELGDQYTPDTISNEFAPFFGDNAVPYTPDMFKSELMIKLTDFTEKFVIERYGVEVQPAVIRMSKALKSWQSLFVLGFNPLYAGYNWINNTVTRSAQGVGGRLNSRQIENFWNRMGVKPARLDVGIGMAGEGADLGRSALAIHEATAGDDWINKFHNVGRMASKLGIFSAIAGNIEVAESRQATTIGAMEMWNKTWKPGIGFERMPANVETALRDISPSLPDIIYSAVRSGMNMDEITANLYKDSVYRGVYDVAERAVQSIFPDAPDVAMQTLNKMGILESLNDVLKDARNTEDVIRGYEYIRSKINEFIEMRHGEEVITKAQDIANRTEAEKWAGVVDIVVEMYNQHATYQLSDLVMNNDYWTAIEQAREQGNTAKAHKLILARQQEADNNWSRRWSNLLETQRGVLEVVGYNSDVAQTYVNSLAKLAKEWNEFYVKRNKIYADLRDPSKNVTWKDAQNALQEMYVQSAKVEIDMQNNMMAALGQIYQESLSRPYTEIKPLLDSIVASRKDISDGIATFRKSLAEANLSRKHKLEAYNAFNTTLKRKIQNLRTLVQNGLYEIKEGRVERTDVVQTEPTDTRTEPTETRVEPAETETTETDIVPTEETEIAPQTEEAPIEESPAAKAVTAKEAYDETLRQSRQNLAEAHRKSNAIFSRQQIEEKVRAAVPNISEDMLASSMVMIEDIAEKQAAKLGITVDEAITQIWGELNNTDTIDGLDKLMQETSPLDQDEGTRGTTQFLPTGEAIVNIMKAGDLSTLWHETFHVLSRMLVAEELDVLAQAGGLESWQEMVDLRQQWDNKTISSKDKARLEQAEEYGANGFERYLAEGVAPNTKLQTIFQKISDWIRNIYEKLTGYNTLFGTPLADVQLGGRYMIEGTSKSMSLAEFYDNLFTQDAIQTEAETTTAPVEKPISDVWDMGPNNLATMDPVTKMAYDRVNQNLNMPEGFDFIYTPTTEYPEPLSDYAGMALYDMIGGVEEGTPGYRREIRNKYSPGSIRVDQESSYPDWYGDETYLQTPPYRRGYKGAKGKDAVVKALYDIQNGITDYADKYLDKNDTNLYRDLVRVMQDKIYDHYDIRKMFDEEYARAQQELGVAQPLSAAQIIEQEQVQYGRKRILAEAWQLTEPINDLTNSYGALAFEQDGVIIAVSTPEVDLEKAFTINGEEVSILGVHPEEPSLIVYDVNGEIRYAPLAKPYALEQGTPQRQPRQPGFFDETQEDLPLFSGTAPRVEGEVFAPKPETRQETLFDMRPKIEPVEDTGDYNTLFQSKPQMPMFGEVPAGGTPGNLYEGAILDEVNSVTLHTLFDEMQSQTIDDFQNNRSFTMADIDPELQRQINLWVKTLPEQMSSAKLTAMNYGELQRDKSLLNYSKRYGIDNILEIVFPYEFWTTRSLGEWGKRMLDRPSWFAMYARYKKEQDKMQQEGIPSRFKDKIRIPASFLPDYMGNSIYVDPMKQLFPFANFGQSLDFLNMTAGNVDYEAESILRNWVQQGLITATQANQAIQTREGILWQEAIAEAQVTMGEDELDPMNITSMMMTPAMWWTYPYYMLKGNADQLNPLPMTRLGQSLRGIGDNEGVLGMIGNILAMPEESIRKNFNLNVYGEWGNYYVDRVLSNMAAEGTYSTDEILLAMQERKGEAYTEAVRRTEEELALRMPGSQTALAIKEGRFGAIPQTLLTTLLPAHILPEGELKQRGLKEEYNQAWRDYEDGDLSAVNKFFEENPEYKARLALFDEPEQRMREFLRDEIWERWNEIDDRNKTLVTEQLGTTFERKFLDRNTRDISTIDLETLAYWSQALGGLVPDTEQTQGVTNIPDYMRQDLAMYSPETLQEVQAYNEMRQEYFPQYKDLQEIYFSLPEYPKETRKQFLAKYPELAAYWDWKDAYEKSHPIIAAWNEEQSERYDQKETADLYTTQQQMLNPIETTAKEYASNLMSPLQMQLAFSYYAGEEFSGGARQMLMNDWLMLGQPAEDFDDWIEMIMQQIFE